MANKATYNTHQLQTNQTTNTTGTGVLLDRIDSDVKSLEARISGSGSVSATVTFQSSSDASVWTTRVTMTLSGTNSASEIVEIANNSPHWRTSIASISGTGATVNTYISGRV